MDKCPNCHMPRHEWPDESDGGYAFDGNTYCCRGCAEGPGCTCLEHRIAGKTAPTKDEIREDKPSGDFVQSLQREHKQIEPGDYGTPAVTRGAPRDAGPD